MPFNNRELFARVIKCEAEGEGENGMRAVATTIMNRVNVPYGEYQRVGQGNIRTIMLQPNQFDCIEVTKDGKSTIRNVFTTPPDDIHFEIADWALGGGKFFGISNSLWYLNPPGECAGYFPPNKSGKYFTTVNQHCFYSPTPKYKTT
jgi:N-acetylmuramoyl-L-alanine amidase